MLYKQHDPVSRVVRRKAKRGCEQAYEDLVRGMLQASSHFPGYVSAAVIPPHTGTGHRQYQIVQRFATRDDLDRWDRSSERELWHERLLAVVDGGADYCPVSGLEVWFAPKVNGPEPPPRWKMTTVSWLGIFPTVAVCLGVLEPLLKSWPFLLKIAVITAVVATLMSYVIMPRLSVWMSWWLKRR